MKAWNKLILLKNINYCNLQLQLFWKKKKKQIEETFNSNQIKPQRKLMKVVPIEDIDKVVLKWLQEKRAVNVPINGPLLCVYKIWSVRQWRFQVQQSLANATSWSAQDIVSRMSRTTEIDVTEWG